MPAGLKGKVEMYLDDIKILLGRLEKEGYKHAYINGGVIIKNGINLELINEMI